jgi:hypothetical protein
MRWQTMQLARSDASKKPYKSPVLIVHGTVKDLTRNIGTHGAFDVGGGRGRIKTSP